MDPTFALEAKEAELLCFFFEGAKFFTSAVGELESVLFGRLRLCDIPPFDLALLFDFETLSCAPSAEAIELEDIFRFL